MIFRMVLAVILWEISGYGIAQCIKPLTDRCEEALVFCSLSELNGFKCQTSGVPNKLNCPVGSPGNRLNSTVWLAFTSQGGGVNLKIKPLHCKGKGGIKAGVTAECHCQTYFLASPDCSDEQVIELIGNLSGAKTYYLFVDACDSSVCEFEITTSGGSQARLPALGRISGPRSVCREACDIRYSVNIAGGLDPAYRWTLGGELLHTNTGEVLLNFEKEGSFELCVKALIGNPVSGSICEETEQICMSIQVSQIPDRIQSMRVICTDELPFDWHGILIDTPGTYKKNMMDQVSCCAFDSVIHVQIWQRTRGQNYFFIAPHKNAAFTDPHSNKAFLGCYNGREITIQGSAEIGKCDSSYFLYSIAPEWQSSFEYQRLKFEAIHTLKLSDVTRLCGTDPLIKYSYSWYLSSDPIKTILSRDLSVKVERTGKYCVEINAEVLFGNARREFTWEVCEQMNEGLIKVGLPEKPLPDSALTELDKFLSLRKYHLPNGNLEAETFKADIFPNPASLHTDLQISSNRVLNQWTLIDLNGKIIQMQNLSQVTSFKLPIHHVLQAGSYYIQLKSADQILTKKFIFHL
ncbi:MAG: T9SS type A sorting domain-containing protein [Saprospiraceae bacterium]|nr:T9SS type A sorting domain-containing protein [Saprospiraceae bacterium]